jgi:hypothetical protein
VPGLQVGPDGVRSARRDRFRIKTTQSGFGDREGDFLIIGIKVFFDLRQPE